MQRGTVDADIKAGLSEITPWGQELFASALHLLYMSKFKVLNYWCDLFTK